MVVARMLCQSRLYSGRSRLPFELDAEDERENLENVERSEVMELERDIRPAESVEGVSSPFLAGRTGVPTSSAESLADLGKELVEEVDGMESSCWIMTSGREDFILATVDVALSEPCLFNEGASALFGTTSCICRFKEAPLDGGGRTIMRDYTMWYRIFREWMIIHWKIL